MIPKPVSCLLVLGIAIAAAGCGGKEVGGELVTPNPVAGLRYVNIVPDTVAMDIRVVDVVGDAPNTFNASFRTGGLPYGVSITGLPVHTAVAAGTREIRAFLSSTNPAIATTVVLDTSFTFDANNNYTVYFWGYANPANGTPTVEAMLVKDTVPTLDTASVAYRVIHLAPTMAPTLGAANVDVTFDTLALADAPTTGASSQRRAAFTNVVPGEVRPYQLVRRRLTVGAVPALNYRVAVAGNATPTVLAFSADVPNGATGTSTVNPVPGDLVSGTAITAILVPRSVAGTGAPQTAAFTAPTVLMIVDQLPPRTAP
jgi:hypothetical protein